MNEIEKAARDYCKEWLEAVYHPNDLTVFFKAGYDFALSMASDGFGALWEADYINDENYGMEAQLAFYKAIKLSCAKELSEKDKEVERLRKDLGLLFYNTRMNYVSPELKQSVKEMIKRRELDKLEALNNGGQG